MTRPVHIITAEGQLACRGLALVRLGEQRDERPPVITVRAEEATCRACKAAWVIIQRRAG